MNYGKLKKNFVFLRKRIMKKTQLVLLFVFSICFVSAQQTYTYTIDWGFGSNPSQLESAPNYTLRTIEVGDTIIWEWVGDGGSHNVVSTGGPESFNSGATTNTPGNTFSHTFTLIGDTTFECQPHSGNMFGTISVVAEGTLLSRDEFDYSLHFKISPNPGKDRMILELPNYFQNAKLQVFDVLGKQIINRAISTLETNIDVTDLNKGVYIVKVISGEQSQTKRFVKQ